MDEIALGSTDTGISLRMRMHLEVEVLELDCG